MPLSRLREGNPPPMSMYSMASASWDDYLEFYSILVPGGAFTSQLVGLKVGDRLMIERKPNGFFTTNRFADGRDLWMLATGTGLAPYLSILQDETTWQRFERLILVHGAREAVDLAYRDEIAALRAHPLWAEHGHKLIYQPVVTREPLAGALPARIPELIRDGRLEAAVGLGLLTRKRLRGSMRPRRSRATGLSVTWAKSTKRSSATSSQRTACRGLSGR